MRAGDIFGSVVRRVAREMKGVKIKGSGVEKRKKLEHIRIKLYDRLFAQKLKSIYQKFPNVDDLPTYLKDLLEYTVGVDRLKMALGRIKGALKALESIRDETLFKIRKSGSGKSVYTVRRQYLARVFDVLKSIEEDIKLVSFAKRQLRSLPNIDVRYPIVVLAGFPNAGKSSLLKALTGSEPEIAPYPFTTKMLLMGRFSDGYRPIQVIDTPGILDRPVEKMKKEEKLALLSMKHFADLVVFLWDPFQDRDSQQNLLNSLKGVLKKPFIVAATKSDIADDRLLENVEYDVKISSVTGEGIEDLKKMIIRSLEGIKW